MKKLLNSFVILSSLAFSKIILISIPFYTAKEDGVEIDKGIIEDGYKISYEQYFQNSCKKYDYNSYKVLTLGTRKATAARVMLDCYNKKNNLN